MFILSIVVLFHDVVFVKIAYCRLRMYLDGIK